MAYDPKEELYAKKYHHLLKIFLSKSQDLSKRSGLIDRRYLYYGTASLSGARLLARHSQSCCCTALVYLINSSLHSIKGSIKLANLTSNGVAASQDFPLAHPSFQ